MTFFSTKSRIPATFSFRTIRGNGSGSPSSDNDGNVGGGEDNYWILNLNSGAGLYTVPYIMQDMYINPSNKNSDIVGIFSFSDGINTEKTSGLAVDTNGTVKWQKVISPYYFFDGQGGRFGAGIDDNNNFYTFTTVDDNSVNGFWGDTPIMYITKMNQDGTSLWQKGIRLYDEIYQVSGSDRYRTYYVYSGIAMNNNAVIGYGIFDEGSNIREPGYIYEYGIFFQKYDTNGNISLRKGFTSLRTDFNFNNRFAYNQDTFEFHKCVLDNSGNLYCLVHASPKNISPYTGVLHSLDVFGDVNENALILMKLNSNLELQWSYALNNNNYFRRPLTYGESKITLDSSGNIYITGRVSNLARTTGYTFLTKLNNNGDVQWIRTINDGKLHSSFDGIGSVTVDENGNVYVAYNYYNQSQNFERVYVLSFTALGNVRWRHELLYNGSPGGLIIKELIVNNYGDLFIWLTKDNDLIVPGTGQMLIKTKSDGSITGSYTVDSQIFTISEATTITSQLNNVSWGRINYPFLTFNDTDSEYYPQERTGSVAQSTSSYVTNLTPI